MEEHPEFFLKDKNNNIDRVVEIFPEVEQWIASSGFSDVGSLSDQTKNAYWEKFLKTKNGFNLELFGSMSDPMEKPLVENEKDKGRVESLLKAGRIILECANKFGLVAYCGSNYEEMIFLDDEQFLEKMALGFIVKVSDEWLERLESLVA